MEATLLILALVIVPALCQIMAIQVFWRRLSRWLQTQDPRTATLVIYSFGPDSAAIARTLARHTRLDLGEIDEIVDAHHTGPLPLPLSWRRANLLVAELRALGTDAALER